MLNLIQHLMNEVNMEIPDQVRNDVVRCQNRYCYEVTL